MLLARRRDPRLTSGLTRLRGKDLRQRRGQVGEPRCVDRDSVSLPLDLVPRLSEPPVVARALVLVSDDGFRWRPPEARRASARCRARVIHTTPTSGTARVDEPFHARERSARHAPSRRRMGIGSCADVGSARSGPTGRRVAGVSTTRAAWFEREPNGTSSTSGARPSLPACSTRFSIAAPRPTWSSRRNGSIAPVVRAWSANTSMCRAWTPNNHACALCGLGASVAAPDQRHHPAAVAPVGPRRVGRPLPRGEHALVVRPVREHARPEDGDRAQAEAGTPQEAPSAHGVLLAGDRRIVEGGHWSPTAGRSVTADRPELIGHHTFRLRRIAVSGRALSHRFRRAFPSALAPALAIRSSGGHRRRTSRPRLPPAPTGRRSTLAISTARLAASRASPWSPPSRYELAQVDPAQRRLTESDLARTTAERVDRGRELLPSLVDVTERQVHEARRSERVAVDHGHEAPTARGERRPRQLLARRRASPCSSRPNANRAVAPAMTPSERPARPSSSRSSCMSTKSWTSPDAPRQLAQATHGEDQPEVVALLPERFDGRSPARSRPGPKSPATRCSAPSAKLTYPRPT